MLLPLAYTILAVFVLALVGGLMLRASAGRPVRLVQAPAEPGDLTAIDLAMLELDRRDARYPRFVAGAGLLYLRVADRIGVDGGVLRVARTAPPGADPLVRACHEALRPFDGAETSYRRDDAILDEVAGARPVLNARAAAERRFEFDGQVLRLTPLRLGTVALATVALGGYALAVAAWSSGGPWLLVTATVIVAGAVVLHRLCVDQASRAVRDLVIGLRTHHRAEAAPNDPAAAVLVDALFPERDLARLDPPLWTLLTSRRAPQPVELSPTYYDKAGGS